MMVNDSQKLNKMLTLVVNSFDGILDKGGQPYVLHCLKVMHYLKTDDVELQCIALGHDLIEDTKVTLNDLVDMGFSRRIVDGIDAMTKIHGEPVAEYLHRIKGNRDAIKVKLCDLRHNSDIRRLKGVTDKDIARMKKYHRMYLELRNLV